jgi:hypothetical protein
MSNATQGFQEERTSPAARVITYRWLAIIYLSFALTLTVYHAFEINRKFWVQRSEYHRAIVAREFKAPYQYRVMAPFLAEAGGRLLERAFDLQSGKPAALAREAVYIVLRFLATWATLVVFHRLMEFWLLPSAAFSATIILFGLHLYTFRSYFYQPSSFLHLLFFVLGVYLVVRHHMGWVYPLMILASLARETSVLLTMVVVAYYWPKRELLRHVAGLFGVWVTVQISLRLVMLDFIHFRLRNT